MDQLGTTIFKLLATSKNKTTLNPLDIDQRFFFYFGIQVLLFCISKKKIKNINLHYNLMNGMILFLQESSQ